MNFDKNSKQLLVPIVLEAMRVGSRKSDTDLYVDMTPDYAAMVNNPPFSNAVTNGFFTTINPNPGVYLHWTMPDALLHGMADDTNMNFPALPNRWIVQRLSCDGDTIKRAAWLIESDFVTNEAGQAEPAKTTIPTFLWDEAAGLWTGAGQTGEIFGYLGDCREYGLPLEKKGYYLDKLTAVGYGNPLFAAFYPYCQSVFGFYDSLENMPAGSYSYLVTGYYEDPAQDPLYHASVDTLPALAWKYAGTETLPDTVCCHGLVRGVDWQGPDQYYPTGAPKDTVDVSIGNTSAEALSALLQDKLSDIPGLERILTALQYNHLHDMDDAGNSDALIDLEYTLHGKQFTPEEGRHIWTLRRLAEGGGQKDLTTEEALDFSRLNTLQDEYDSLLETADSLREQIYFAWWKYVLANDDPFAEGRKTVRDARFLKKFYLEKSKLSDPEDYRKQIQGYLDQLSGIDDKTKQNQTEITDIVQKLTAALESKNLTLQKQRGERYYAPNPPVLVLSGAGVKRAFKQGFQSDNDGLLPCREDCIAFIDLCIGDRKISITAEEVCALFSPARQSLPEIVELLLAEAVMLDDTFAGVLSVSAFKKALVQYTDTTLQDTIKTTQKLQAELSASDKAPFGIGNNIWRQPWSPLLMEWSVDIYPARSKTNPDDSFTKFTLEEIDFDPGETGTSTEPFLTIQGATLISPHGVINLSAMLQQLIKDYGAEGAYYASLQRALESIKNMEALSQGLDGFNDALLMRDKIPFLPLYDDSPNAETEKMLTAMNSRIKNHGYLTSPRIGQDGSVFFPIRGGTMKLGKLWIVDSFGQVKDIAHPAVRTAETMRGKTGDILLRPRFLQPCAIEMEWISAANVLAADPAASPIFGYILASFLDGAIQIHDASGIFLGFVQKSDKGAKWMPPPGSRQEADTIQNDHLRSFVQGLLGDDNPALDELLKCLDRSFAAMSPTGQTEFMQLCFGRVLALVRARVNVYGKGISPQAQLWNTGSENNGFNEAEFHISLGDSRCLQDGLAGFYVEDVNTDAYKQFHTCVQNTGCHTYVSEASFITHCLKDAPAILTLLMDPAGYVSLRTGFLPELRVVLPGQFYEEAVQRMEMMFRAAPLINRMDAFAVNVPGAMRQDEWSFLYVDTTRTLRHTDCLKRYPSLPVPGRCGVAEGFLKTEYRQEEVNHNDGRL
ncbi:MAG: hypothetical protein LBT16_02965 [Treponema sp.]|jgi:hypothetical protein|nr:hypothetical protein [Treponema sp.]